LFQAAHGSIAPMQMMMMAGDIGGGGGCFLTDLGLDLLQRLLTYDPSRRISAGDALNHRYFKESPLPQSKAFMPTYPPTNEGRRRDNSEKSPENRIDVE